MSKRSQTHNQVDRKYKFKEIQTCRDRNGYRDKERQTDKDTAKQRNWTD